MKKIVMVTGAAGILGRAVVEALLTEGWDVVGVDLAPLDDERLALAFGGTQLGDETAMAAVNARIADELGGLHGLVNVAGGFAWETLRDGSLATWDELYATNVRTAVAACRTALAALTATKGAIVNVGAAASVRAGMGMGAYAASKSGVARLTEALAEESKDYGVRVNAVLPSIIDTPRNRVDMPDAEFSRWVTPQQLAEVIVFLLSPAAAPITGALIPINGQV